MIGQTISHYTILEKLGEGGMGVVYKARDTKLDRTVALKFLPDRVNSDDTAKSRFLQEAKAVAALNHPHICTIFNVEEEAGSVFMVMEYVEGGTLRNKIPCAKHDDAVTIAIQIGEALQEAHAHGVVHRDIKADNVMLTPRGQVKVMDFGLAKLKGSLKLTKTSSTVGTLGYMAPEQIQGGEVDHRSDIFSFGVLLFEMLTGKLPFRGEHEAAMVYSIVNEEPQDIAELLPELSPIVGNLIWRCLEKNPGERYQHFDDVVADLKRSQKKTSKVSRSTSDRPISEVHAVTASGTRKSAPGSVVPVRGMRWGLVVGGAALAAVLIGAGWYLLKGPGGSGDAAAKSIAVLPFVNAAGSKDDDFFTEGVTEDILTNLSKVSGLRVLSRFTLKEYDSKGKTPAAIGRELNVSSLLVGTIRRSGERLRISCQLINTDSEAEIWAETYDRKLDDVFAIQDDIARRISSAMQAQLTPDDTRRLADSPTTTTEAHDAYMQARYFMDQPGMEPVRKAAEYFQRAIRYDSTYAPAWDGLASTRLVLAGNGLLPITEANLLARREVERALELDPRLASAYGTLGNAKQVFDWDWTGADAAFRRGRELDPGNARLIGRASVLAQTLGRIDEAIHLRRQALALEPLRSTQHFNLSLSLRVAGRYAEAEAACRKAIELSPTESGYHGQLAGLLVLQTRHREAMDELAKETEPLWRAFWKPILDYGAGRKADGDNALRDLIAQFGDVGAVQVAYVYAFSGNRDKTFEWLERAYALRDGGLSELVGEPLLEGVKGDPRYAAFMKKMNLPILEPSLTH